MIKVTLDTNVLVSGTFWTGNSYRILNLIDHGEIVSIFSIVIIDEYVRIVESDELLNKIEEKKLMIVKNIQKIFNNSIIVEPTQKINITEDPDDNKIIECALEGNVNFIISQDNHLLKLKEFRGIRIVTPEEFLMIFERT
ncbi:MAG: putative toxin-antitoxin system toxin component, PIN family [Candidatus Aenigmatarchaeota archaeon]